MKNALLKLSVLGSAMAIFTHAYADVNAIPSLSPGFAVSFTGLYLQPSANNMVYAVRTSPLPAPAPNWAQVSVNPGFSPAFDLGLHYTLADSVDQLSLDWLHFDKNYSDSVTSTPGNSVAPPYYFGPGAQALLNSAASSNANFNVDDVNLAFGHAINLGNHLQIQPFAGINTAYLKQELTDTYTGQDSSHVPYIITSYNSSAFTGIGPRLGFDGTYFVTNRFGITAEMAASLLAGSMQTTTTFNAYYAGVAGNDPAATTTLADQSQMKLVPEIDSKLGMDYAVAFNSGSSLTLEAGYMFNAYINGITQVVPTSLVPGAFNDGTIAIETDAQNQSDLDLNGPYLSATWKF